MLPVQHENECENVSVFLCPCSLSLFPFLSLSVRMDLLEESLFPFVCWIPFVFLFFQIPRPFGSTDRVKSANTKAIGYSHCGSD